VSLEGITRRMANGTYPLTRTAVGTRDARGLWVEGAPSTAPLTCGIFPGAPAELMPKLEGRRVEHVITIYSEIELRAAAPALDRVTYLGASYAVFSVDTYSARGFSLYVGLASREAIP
jgi:hypothetical protein